MTLVLTVFLSLFGFYLVKNSIERDTQTGVGQIIATTPISRPAYLIGQMAFALPAAGVMVVILAAAALVMQLFGSESALDPWRCLRPSYWLPCRAWDSLLV